MKLRKIEKMKRRADVLMVEKGETEKALKIFEEILSHDKEYSPALKGKGCALACLGRDNEAEECFDKILQDYPKDIYALNGKASLRQNQGRHKEAMELCDKALSILPGDYTTLRLKDGFLEELGLPQEMIATDHREDYVLSDLNGRLQFMTKEDYLASEEGRGTQIFSLQ